MPPILVIPFPLTQLSQLHSHDDWSNLILFWTMVGSGSNQVLVNILMFAYFCCLMMLKSTYFMSKLHAAPLDYQPQYLALVTQHEANAPSWPWRMKAHISSRSLHWMMIKLHIDLRIVNWQPAFLHIACTNYYYTYTMDIWIYKCVYIYVYICAIIHPTGDGAVDGQQDIHICKNVC